MVNATDVARIHVAAAIDLSLTNQRIIGFANRYNWNLIADAIKKAKPKASKLPSHNPDEGIDLTEPDNGLAKDLLKKFWNQDDFMGLNESIAQNVEHLV